MNSVESSTRPPQVPVREEVAAEKEAPDRDGAQERLEGLLGVPQGDHPALLPLRLLQGESLGGGRPQAPHHRRRSHPPARARAPQEGLRLLPLHRIWRRVFIRGECEGVPVSATVRVFVLCFFFLGKLPQYKETFT